MADNSSLMFSLQSEEAVSTSQLHITGFITMALFQPMHGAAIQAAPIPTALICTVCTLAWYGVVTVNWE